LKEKSDFISISYLLRLACKESCQPKALGLAVLSYAVPSSQKLQEKAGHFPAVGILRANLACLILFKSFLEKVCKNPNFSATFLESPELVL
jgi:hypothetical protein